MDIPSSRYGWQLPARWLPARRLPALAACTAAPLLAVLLLAMLLQAVPAAAAHTEPAYPQRSSRDLGIRLCAPYGPYCAALWRTGLAGGMPFNVLIAEVCAHVRVYENEDAGIACVETAIRTVPSLPDGVLVTGQFAPGERARNGIWHDKSDRQWGQTVAAYFQRIPTYCDHATPVIYEYFGCLVREVVFFQAIIKRYRIVWRQAG